MSTKRCTTSRLTPEWPRASTCAAERQHGPDLVGRKLVADGDGMGAEQPVLQGRCVLRGEVHVCQAAETRRHPVDDLAGLECREDDPAGAVDPPEDLLAQPRRGAPGDLGDVFDVERAPQCDRRGCCHEPSIAARR